MKIKELENSRHENQFWQYYKFLSIFFFLIIAKKKKKQDGGGRDSQYQKLAENHSA